jgi:hypothetical protein
MRVHQMADGNIIITVPLWGIPILLVLAVAVLFLLAMLAAGWIYVAHVAIPIVMPVVVDIVCALAAPVFYVTSRLFNPRPYRRHLTT